ncbi:hypothetical protein BgiBS90_003998, partial [Biomphalaria glabrata]
MISAQNTLQAFLSDSVVMEGDPVTIICGTRHFESPSARLLCASFLTLFKLTERTGTFTQLLSYNNVQDIEQQRSI